MLVGAEPSVFRQHVVETILSAVRANIGTRDVPPPMTVLWGVTKK